MSDNSSTSDQRAKIAPPRTAPEADVAEAVVPLVDLGVLQAVTGVQRKKKKPRIAYEALPKAVRNEFKKLIASREDFEASIYRRVSDQETARDLTGDMFTEMLLKLVREEYNDFQSQHQYAWGIATNLVRKHWQRTRFQVQGEGPDSPPVWHGIEVLASDPLELDDVAQEDRAVAFNEMEGIKELFQHCAQTLTQRHLQVLYLHTLCDHPWKYIAAMLGCKESTLRVRHHEAVTRIRADVVGLADWRLATKDLTFSTKMTENVPYEKRIAVARLRFAPQK
ncbi:sigma-70 family RNA polymerase sigma factor [Streptomyces sp. NPDC057403]|uniref:sigma-70 family RNA polymerase sigma factor n=1 Tax=Streptomyces sp. NPDC057403 TaxID=3346119 RepID=UPI00368D71C8